MGVSASNLSVGDLWFSIGLICVLYFFFIIAEMYLMFKYARLGPSALKTGKYYFENNHLNKQGDGLCLDYEILRIIWWVLVVVLLIGFSVTDGFDMGVTALLPVAGKEA